MKRITLPAAYKGIALRVEGRVALEHADLDFKSTENLLYIALAQADVRGPEIAFILQRDEKFRWAFEDFMAKVEKRQIKSICRYKLPTANIWTCENLRDLPVEASCIIIPDANTIAINPITAAYKNVIAAGVIADRGHWFYSFCREEETHKIEVDYLEVIEAYPNEKKRVLPSISAEFPRMMELKDELIEVPPFRSFAKKFLKVRTDKGREYLSPLQQKEAENQLGKAWHSGQFGAPVVTFDVSKLQKIYLAKKRWWRQKKNINKVLLLKYRRGGFTTIEQGINYSVIRSRQRSQVATIAHTDKSTKRIFRIAHLFHELDKKAPKTINESKSGIELANGSYFFIGTAGGRGDFRGDTVQRVHGSEVAFWCDGPQKNEKVEDVMAAILGAASRGEIVLETTPNGIEWFANTYKEAKAGKNDWGYIFLRWFDDPSNILPEGHYIAEEILDSLTDKEKFLIGQHNLSLGQIAFRRKVYRDYKKLAPQEFPEDDESCFIVGGTCFFDVQDMLDWIDDQHYLNQPTIKHVPGGAITIWEEPVPGVKYVAGCDTSEGLPNCDYNGTGIMRKDNGKQVAKVYGLFRPPQLAELTVELCTYYNNALLGVEREAYGSAVLQKVKELGYSRPHFRGGPLYYFKRSKSKAGQRSGWDTNAITRPAMLDQLYEYVQLGLEEFGIINDRDFVGECLTFRLQSNGKFEADSGTHDDCVMMWAIANQMRLVHIPKPEFFIPGEEHD